MRDKIKHILLSSIQVKEELIRTGITPIIDASNLVISCLKKGGKVIIFGNGGSAADSQHIAAELIGRFQKERCAMPAIALTVNTSVLTSIGNDYGYENVFSRQIEALGKKNDVVIGISTSGKAKNIIKAINKAKEMGLETIALTGGSGADLARLADISIVVPCAVTARIQEAHITIGHIICELAEEAISST